MGGFSFFLFLFCRWTGGNYCFNYVPFFLFFFFFAFVPSTYAVKLPSLNRSPVHSRELGMGRIRIPKRHEACSYSTCHRTKDGVIQLPVAGGSNAVRTWGDTTSARDLTVSSAQPHWTEPRLAPTISADRRLIT